MKVLVTGAAGFIGMHVAQILLARGEQVVGLDNLNTYYDPQLKHDRLARLQGQPGFSFVKLDVADRAAIAALFAEQQFDGVVHLAAQAGVRYSLIDPHAHIDSNIVGFTNILEGCRHQAVKHLVYASSSSVYGGNTVLPFSEHHAVDHPVSLYAASKKANELMAHTYSHLFGIPTTGLRFFTVYGPWGRPDMALFLFTKAILAGEPIQVFNHGQMVRDFTYIDDIAEGVVRTLDRPPRPDAGYDRDAADTAGSWAPYRVFNIGNHDPVKLMDFIEAIERHTGKAAVKDFQPIQPGDVPATHADVEAFAAWTGFRTATSIDSEVGLFVACHRSHLSLENQPKEKTPAVKATVIGAGYVGLITGACHAKTRNRVVSLNVIRNSTALQQRGDVLIQDPVLEATLQGNAATRRVKQNAYMAAVVAHGTSQFIGLATPSEKNPFFDKQHVLNTGQPNGHKITESEAIFRKNCLPLPTPEKVRTPVDAGITVRGVTVDYEVTSNSTFFSGVAAVGDLMSVGQTPLSSKDDRAFDLIRALHRSFMWNHLHPTRHTEPTADHPGPLLASRPAAGRRAASAARSSTAQCIEDGMHKQAPRVTVADIPRPAKAHRTPHAQSPLEVNECRTTDWSARQPTRAKKTRLARLPQSSAMKLETLFFLVAQKNYRWKSTTQRNAYPRELL